jgi:hypothetical protein
MPCEENEESAQGVAMKIDFLWSWRTAAMPSWVEERFRGAGPFDLTLKDVENLTFEFDVAFILKKRATADAKDAIGLWLGRRVQPAVVVADAAAVVANLHEQIKHVRLLLDVVESRAAASPVLCELRLRSAARYLQEAHRDYVAAHASADQEGAEGALRALEAIDLEEQAAERARRSKR